MKRFIFMIAPLLVLFLAFRPVNVVTVTGKVTDEAGNPLAGVTVQEKGSAHAVVTAGDGRFSLTVSGMKSKLVFTSPGFETLTISLNSRTSVNVTLKAAGKSMQKVVVTGYGGRGKRNMAVSQGYYKLPGAPPGYYQGPTYGTLDSEFNTEGYDNITENRFLGVTHNPLSTFSIDVDAASYSNVRRFLKEGQLPPAGAVRIEEMINYFRYEYPQPTDGKPFSINTEISDAPWNPEHKLVLIGLQGKKIPAGNLPPSNLVFLIDVSGSMAAPNKLPLVKSSIKMLVDQLREQDRVSIVVYAGAAGLVLPATGGNEKMKIKDAIDRLESGGSTAGGAGIKLAYSTARQNYQQQGNNRVILCTDGDFNVGESSDDAMERMIEEERKSGVFLTVLGYGMGNYKDNKMQKLADKGNGNHAYIDGVGEARKVLVNEFGGTLFTIAKDVKLQVEFNPAKVAGYRLIGYENRMLAKEDFNNDKKDAGDLGSGHTVTALYEIIPAGVKSSFLEKVDDLKYGGKGSVKPSASQSDELLTVKFRYKTPEGQASSLIEHAVFDKRLSLSATSDNFRFAAAVAEFGMLLRNSEFKSAASFENVLVLAKNARGGDPEGYRAEFIGLVEAAGGLAKNRKIEPIKAEMVKIPGKTN